MTSDAEHVLKHNARVSRCLQRLRQDDIVEGVVRVVAEVRIGVTLDDGQSLGDAFVNALAGQFYTAAVHAAAFAQEAQQFAIAASDVEHFCAALNHLGDQNQVDTGATGRAGNIGHSEIGIGGRQPFHGSALWAQAARLAGAVEEAAHDRKKFRLIEQEGIMALVGDDFGERHPGTRRIERMHDRPRLRGRE